MDHAQYQALNISCSISSKKKKEIVTDNPPTRIYIDKMENRITAKIKTWFYLELLND